MQAIILAAGKGTRMRPLTLERPKPLIEIAGKTILERNLEQMRGLVSEAIMVVGYKKEMIIEKFGEDFKGIKLSYALQEEQLGTGHALLQAKERVKGKFLVLNGDDLFSKEDIENLIRHENSILLQRKKEIANFGVAVVKDGLVVDFVEKPKEFVSDLVSVGMYCFGLEIFEILKNLKKSERGEYEITDAIKVLAEQGRMSYEKIKGFWIPVGYPEDIEKAEELLSRT